MNKDELLAELEDIRKEHLFNCVNVGARLAKVAAELNELYTQMSDAELGQIEVLCHSMGKATLENVTENRCRIQGTINKTTATGAARVIKAAPVTKAIPSSTAPKPVKPAIDVSNMTPEQKAKLKAMLDMLEKP